MTRALLALAFALIAPAGLVSAQTAGNAIGSTIAARLPEPLVDADASVQTLLTAARNALAAGRGGEAQEALEMAETRALDRSVPLFQTSVPIQDPVVARIAKVLQTLGAGDRLETMRLLEQAIAEGAAAR